MAKSRFRYVSQYTVIRADGTFITVYGRRRAITSTVNTVITTNSADRLDTVAYDAYGDARLWWALSDVSSIIDPFDMFRNPGEKIIIPSLTDINNVIR